MNAMDAPLRLKLANSQGNSTPNAPTGPGKRILIVDDNLILLKTLSVKLRSSGYEVSTAVDGSQAVSTVRQQRPDLILLDISFPPDVGHGGGVAWDGFLILNWLRRMDESLNTPVIIITASDPAKYKARCLAAGVASYFQKPINHEELLSEISKILLPTTRPQSASASKKILFVDDETDWRFMAGVYLKEAGFEVVSAVNGTEALTRLREDHPDLVLLDLNLAGESGLEVLQGLRGVDPNVRVVLYTGLDHAPAEIEGMLRLGARHYLRKGTMGEMLQVVQTALAA